MKSAENIYIGFRDKTLFCSGAWLTPKLGLIEKEFARLTLTSYEELVMDLSALADCDVNGAILLHALIEGLRDKKITITLHNIPSEAEHLLNITRLREEASLSVPRAKESLFATIGAGSYRIWLGLTEYFFFSGQLAFALFYALRYPSSFRIKELLRSIQEHSIKALPIVLLTSMLIGLVIAYQSALQIQKYGADIFVVDMLVISVTRELSPLIVAIVIAGRSGSAYTAQLGVMKITEEIDAMRTMGFDPFRFIVLPNVLALMIGLPMIIFLADIMGIVGGILAARVELGITVLEFVGRVEEIFNIKHLFVGLIKGPFFALIIASIGSMRGMAVENSTDSIGTNTKASVVSAIFMVIICDAIFSIIFLELGI